MDSSVECGQDETVAARYLAGRLTEAEAEAFEAHYFGCGRCWGEVRTAQEVRAALRPGKEARSAFRRTWMPLAAAAALVAALGTWMLVRTPTGETERVFRAGRGAELELTLSLEPAGVRVSWPAAAGVSAYRVRVVTAEGTLVTEREVSGPPVLLEKERLPATRLYVSVQALGPDRQVLAASAPRTLPTQPASPR